MWHINNNVSVFMPLAHTWSEELIAEWLILKGYFVSTDVPIGSGGRGGRKEADIIGFKALDNGKYEILYVEVSSCYQSAKNIVGEVNKKFSSDRVENIKKLLRYHIGDSVENASYKKVFICLANTIAVNKARDMLKKYDIEVKTIDEIIYEIIDTVNKWESHLKNEGIIRQSTQVTPPQSLWLIQLLYYLYKNGRLTLQ